MSDLEKNTAKVRAIAVTPEEACQCDESVSESRHVPLVLIASLALAVMAFAVIYAAYLI